MFGEQGKYRRAPLLCATLGMRKRQEVRTLGGKVERETERERGREREREGEPVVKGHTHPNI